ncbi:MAG: DHH family phosphoesterase [Lachnospiraceae bacterium]|nr:DHH family phosphoesterase [Lachnospiraceae bacterium]
MDKTAFLKLIEYLKGKRVFVQTHNFPDPDAIGSGFGLLGILKHYGIEAVLCYVGQIDRVNMLRMMKLCDIEIFAEDALPVEMRESDPVICIDSQKDGGNIRDLPGDEIACIDHHPKASDVKYRYSDIRIVGSCCTLIAEYYKELGIEPDEHTATAMLYGMKMDTLHFTRGVTLKDIEMYGFLFPHANADNLTELTTNSMEFKDLQAYASAIDDISVYGRTGFAGIPFACTDAQLAVVADFILSLEEVEVAVLFAKRDDGIKFSVRSETPSVHAGKLIAGALAGIGNGGGHAFMAGGFIPKEKTSLLGESPEEAIKERFLRDKI